MTNFVNRFDNQDIVAEACANITSDFFHQAIEVIDCTFGKGYAKRNPLLLAAFMQAAATKNQGEVIAIAIEPLAQSIDSALAGR